jgi:hypothetical protein
MYSFDGLISIQELPLNLNEGFSEISNTNAKNITPTTVTKFDNDTASTTKFSKNRIAIPPIH